MTLIISAVYDGPIDPFGFPKGIELYAAAEIPDLSLYSVGFADDGGGSDGEEFFLPAISLTAGQHYYLTTFSDSFTTFFGFAPDFANSNLGIDGNDSVELFFEGTRIDVFGDVNVDGTGEPWEYTDGWAYRDSNTGPSTTFVVDDWTFSGPDALDGETSNGTATTPVPIGTFFCFAAGTWIATPSGERVVESLSIGDVIVTQDGRTVEVKWVGRQTVRKHANDPRLEPVRISAGALGHGVPHQDLVVTADHGMVIDGLVINASALVNGDTIDFVPIAELGESFTVYHIETEAHDVILANGAPSETFIDVAGRAAFDNYQEYMDVYGHERIIPAQPLPRISSARLVPQVIRDRLTGTDRTTSLAHSA